MTDDPMARAAYDQVANGLALSAGAEVTRMFGMPTVKYRGKVIAGYHQGAMAFKLDGEPHARAMGLAGASVFDPSGMGRPMKKWVLVPFEHADLWPELAEAAKESVG